MSKKNINYKGEKLRVSIGDYASGGLAIQLYDEEGFPYMTASVWIEGLGPDEIAIKNYNENEGILDALIESGLIEKPHRFVRSGYVTIPVCKHNIVR